MAKQNINGLSVINNALSDVTKNLPEMIKVGDKEVTDKALIVMNAKATLLLTARKISDKAMCLECARLTLEEVKKYGFSSVLTFVGKMFELDLTSGQITDYIRVGKIFGDRTRNGYHWKKGIAEAVTMTNLRDVLGLVFEDCPDKESKDVNKLSDTDLDKLFNRFMEKYPDCPLQASNKTLREWKSNLKKSQTEDANIIKGTATEIDGNGTPDNAPEKLVKASDKAIELIENIQISVMALMNMYSENDSIGDICLDIKNKLDSIEFPADTETEEVSDTGEAPETETENA